MAHAVGNVEVGGRGYRGSLAAPYRIRKLFMGLAYATVSQRSRNEHLDSAGEWF